MKIYRIVGVIPKINLDVIKYIESMGNKVSAGDLFLLNTLNNLGLNTRTINSFYENGHYGTYATRELAQKALSENKPYNFSYLEKYHGYRFIVSEEELFKK